MVAIGRRQQILERNGGLLLGQERVPRELALEFLAIFGVHELVDGLVDHVGLVETQIRFDRVRGEK